jgi:hypothetical protein
MPQTVTPTPETAAGCKWSRVGFRQNGLPPYANATTEPMWVCARDPEVTRAVTDADCDGCPHWEKNPPHPWAE